MRRSICLATVDFAGPVKVGGIGSYFNEMAKLLSKNGWDVTVLFHGYELGKFADEYYEKYHVPIYHVNELIRTYEQSEMMRENFQSWLQARSQIFHAALQILMIKHDRKFNLIEFSDWGASGFIPAQMKKSSRAYANTNLIVKLHSPSAWGIEGNGREWSDWDDLKTDYLERYSFENADIQGYFTRYMRDWCRQHGWKIRPNARLCGFPFSPSLTCPPILGFTERDEIAFFGRWEARKGVSEFIDALHRLRTIDPSFPRKYRIAFIGKEGGGIGSFSKDVISQRLDPYRAEFMTMESREDALKHLVENVRLVVIPSRSDNIPNTVVECMVSGIPFVTTRSGGIPEMLGVGSELYRRISVDIRDANGLATLIRNCLRYDEAQVQRLIDSAHRRGKAITDPQKILRWYEECLNDQNGSRASTAKSHSPGVTIIVPTCNASKYLNTTLQSLANQSYKNTTTIIKDSSTDPNEILKTRLLAGKYGMRLIHQRDSGLPNALNQGLNYAASKYVMQFDADNIALPHMVETFVRAIEGRSDVAALASYNAQFYDENERKVLDNLSQHEAVSFVPRSAFRPLGPCLPNLFFENVQGDGSGIYLTKVLKTIGGWVEDNRGHTDWLMWLRLIETGHWIDVIPEILYYYRVRPDSASRINRPLIEVDQGQVPIIQGIIRNRSGVMSACYPSMHRLLRQPASGLASEQFKMAALYLLNERLGQLSVKHAMFRRFLESTGRLIRLVLSKTA